MIRVLIVDAQTILRHGLRLILQEDPGIEVLGEAGNGAEALRRIKHLQPDVVLLDLHLPDLCGTQLISQIRQCVHKTQVLVLTTPEHNGKMLTACTAGAKAYLLKNVSGAEVVQAVYQVAAGQAVLPASLTTHLFNELANPTPSPDPLTKRELEVLDCMRQGLGNKEIAKTLHISQNTVKTHIRRIFAKLNIHNRTEAAMYAVETNRSIRI